MKRILQLKKLLIIPLLFLAGNVLGQEQKSILFNEINHHLELGDFDRNLLKLASNFKQETKGNEQYMTCTINNETINSIIKNSYKFISFEIPFSETENKIVLLKKRELLDDEFKLAIQEFNGKNESANKPNYVAYSGLLKSNLEQSLVSVIFYDNEIHASVFINDKEFTTTKIDKNENTYKMQEVIFDENRPAYVCGVRDEDNVNLKETVAERNQQTIIPKCVKLHFELTKTLNDQFGGINQSILQFFNHFNLVQTKFANEGITVRVSYLKIWNTDDPYYQSWNGSPGAPGAYQDLGFQSFQSLGGNINGNIGILLGTFIGGIGGLSGGAPCANQGYNTVSIRENSLNQDSATIMHEIGHSLGSHHTHWCGWVGGALDNCAPTEGGCSPGPAPTNGGTIMSYCGGYSIINNGFGSQPNTVINNTVANQSCITSCNSDITCDDNIVNATSITNTTPTSFTVNWTSSYAVKVYFKLVGVTNFTLLNTVNQPNNNYIINYTPPTDCTIQKFEIKLVAVCPNGDSKPTVVVYSPQLHSKPYVGSYEVKLCNTPNPSINNLPVVGQNLKFYTNSIGGLPISNSIILPLNTHINYYISQTINNCESERVLGSYFLTNDTVVTPITESSQTFYCSNPSIADIYANNLQNSNWYNSQTGGSSLLGNVLLVNNQIYYIENVERPWCKSERLPVQVFISSATPPAYSIPFIETFDKSMCTLGWTWYGTSGRLTNYTFKLANFNSDPNDDYTISKSINLVAGTTYYVSFKAKKVVNNQIGSLITRIYSTNNNFNLGTYSTNSDSYSNVNYTITPSVSGQFRLRFQVSAGISDGFYIDDLSISTSLNIEEVSDENNFNVYPNPTDNILNIDLINKKIQKIEIFDLQGRLLETIIENKQKYQIDISNFSSATYLVKLSTENGSQTVKVVKK